MTSSEGTTHTSLVLGIPAVVGMMLVLLQGVINGFTVTDLLAGILTTLVIWTLKKIFDVERQLAALDELVHLNKEELDRVRDEKLRVINDRLHALEVGDPK